MSQESQKHTDARAKIMESSRDIEAEYKALIDPATDPKTAHLKLTPSILAARFRVLKEKIQQLIDEELQKEKLIKLWLAYIRMLREAKSASQKFLEEYLLAEEFDYEDALLKAKKADKEPSSVFQPMVSPHEVHLGFTLMPDANFADVERRFMQFLVKMDSPLRSLGSFATSSATALFKLVQQHNLVYIQGAQNADTAQRKKLAEFLHGECVRGTFLSTTPKPVPGGSKTKDLEEEKTQTRSSSRIPTLKPKGFSEKR